MEAYYLNHGAEHVPADAFALWNLFRDTIEPTHESMYLGNRASSPEETPLLYKPPDYKNIDADLSSDSEDGGDKKEDKLIPSGEEDLEEAAAHYHNKDWPPAVAPVAATVPPPKSKKKMKGCCW